MKARVHSRQRCGLCRTRGGAVRKIIYYVATSADGYIARPDGDVSWLERPRPKGNYGMAAFHRSVDTVLMGRRTYEVARAFGHESHPGKKNYVFSHARRR